MKVDVDGVGLLNGPCRLQLGDGFLSPSNGGDQGNGDDGRNGREQKRGPGLVGRDVLGRRGQVSMGHPHQARRRAFIGLTSKHSNGVRPPGGLGRQINPSGLEMVGGKHRDKGGSVVGFDRESNLGPHLSYQMIQLALVLIVGEIFG